MSTVPTPADLITRSLEDLAAERGRHLWTQLHALSGPPAESADLRAAALSILAIEEQIMRRLRGGRWVTVLDALRAGAGIDDVATATGLTVAEVRSGFTAWADGQDDLAEVAALLDDMDGWS